MNRKDLIEIEKMDYNQLQKDLPQLIVALDSTEESANYIHINDAKEDTTYYCPCCKGIIKPRAYKDDKEYQVQPHYYHENGGCNEESFVHYICKQWLFESGCEFKIDNFKYTVDSIDVEKTYNTSFGEYKPDITIHTTIDKTFFFEIRNTNKKTEHYIPKWDELGNDVVEVDVRYFINQKFTNDIPQFNLIYSDGECFIKSYIRSDYDETIAKRKLEWKRQDKLNYKIMWERLDWFWTELQDFKIHGGELDKLLESFKTLSNKDKEICFNIIKKMSCIKGNNDSFREIINKDIQNEFSQSNIGKILDKNIKVKEVEFIERDRVYISCYYKSTISKTKTINLSKVYYSQKWTFDYSKIKNMIDEINENAKRLCYKEQQYLTIRSNVNKVILNLKKQINSTIWELTFDKTQVNTWDQDYRFNIKIKNSYYYDHSNVFYVDIFNFENASEDDIYKYVIKKLEESMNDIFGYVNKYDGIYKEYRHVFITKDKGDDECQNN